MIGQQLQRDDFQDRQQLFRRGRNVQHVVGGFFDVLVAFGGQRDDHSGAGFHLFEVGAGFFVAGHRERVFCVTRRDDHHRKVLVNQRVGAVLHFSGGIAFGVNVGNFLQLERAFERDGIVNAASQEQEVLRARILLGQVFTFFFAGQQMFELAGNAREFLDRFFGLIGAHGAALLRQVERKQVQAR